VSSSSGSARGGKRCETEIHRVREELDVFEARRSVRSLAMAIGFGVQAREELVIVVSELGSNILKYGISGDITFEALADARRGAGIRLTARDIGPPFANWSQALVDGCSDKGPIDPLELRKRKGFGGGLGAVVRFSDSLELRPGVGEKRLCVERYVTRPKK
jgi:anti-sigma regulatory factor (Ser/Thr protein kinase)